MFDGEGLAGGKSTANAFLFASLFVYNDNNNNINNKESRHKNICKFCLVNSHFLNYVSLLYFCANKLFYDVLLQVCAQSNKKSASFELKKMFLISLVLPAVVTKCTVSWCAMYRSTTQLRAALSVVCYNVACCTTLLCAALQCSVLQCCVLHYSVVCYIVACCTTMLCATMLHAALHCCVLHCCVLRYRVVCYNVVAALQCYRT